MKVGNAGQSSIEPLEQLLTSLAELKASLDHEDLEDALEPLAALTSALDAMRLTPRTPDSELQRARRAWQDVMQSVVQRQGMLRATMEKQSRTVLARDRYGDLR